MKCFHTSYGVKKKTKLAREHHSHLYIQRGQGVLPTTEVGLFFHTVLSFPKCVEAPSAFDPTEGLEISELELLDSLLS